MIVTAINGSPKGKNSNTEVMLASLLEGFRENGDIVKNITLSEFDINYCSGCYSCWFKTPGICIKKDDMSTIISEMDGSDIIILGSPLYFNNLSGTLKVFIDRLTVCGGSPHNVEKKEKVNPKYIMVSNCGFPMIKQFDVVSLWVKHFCQLLQTQLLAEFYTPHGKVLTTATEEQLASKNSYLNFLKECAIEISKVGELSEEKKERTIKSLLEF